MDKENEALLRRRPWSQHKDEEEEQANQLAANDSTLAAFKDRSEKFNQRVRNEFASIPVPADLREKILAGPKVIRVEGWRNPQRFLAIAAAALFLGAGVFFWVRPKEDLTIAGFRSRMVGFALREYRMDILTRDWVQLRDFLASKGVPSDFQVPPNLAATPLKGGAKLTWQGKPVSMVCFDGAKGNTLYMFVLGESAAAGTQFEPVKGLATATWLAEGKTFVLAGHFSQEELARIVKS